MAIQLLLADDKPAIAKIISLSLPREEYQITTVTTGEEVLAKAASLSPQILLIDVSLPFNSAQSDPDRDGLFVTRQIKTHPELRKIRVILLTNAFEPVDDRKMQEFQADGVLIKPFEPSELRTKLRDLSLKPAPSPSPAPAAKPAMPASPARPPMPTFTQEISLSEPSGLDVGDSAELSPNAQALAQFFSSEIAINQNATPPGMPAKPSMAPAAPSATPRPPKPNLDISLDASPATEIEIPDFAAAAAEWKPKQPAVESDLSVWRRVDQGQPEKSKDVFDIADSNFQFSTDYISRVGLDGIPPSFQQNIDVADRGPMERPAPPNGLRPSPPTAPMAPIAAPMTPPAPPAEPALSTAETEAIIREETRLRVREIAEKVAWEVIPELAENLIRRELDKVLAELESHSPTSSS